VGLGKVAITERPMAINQDIKAVIPSSEILPDFLFWFLLSHGHEIERMGTGATVKGVTLNDIRAIRMPLPPMPEQRRIVDILSRAESIIHLRRKAQKKAAELIPALFLDMFGNPATNPKGWPEKTIDEVALVQGGLQVSKTRQSLPIEMPYLRVANVYRTHLDLSEIKYIRLTEVELKRVLLNPRDLLVVEGHGNPAEIGRVGIWNGSIRECVHQNHLIRIRCRFDMINPAYLWAMLNSASGRLQLLQHGKTTSGLNTISVTEVKSVRVMLPPIDLQNRFECLVEECHSIQSQQTAATEKTEATFDALLSRTFSTATTPDPGVFG
jgi:type I restriction enzyme, S subunit